MTFEYDPGTAEFQADPYAVYRVLRDRYPVYHNQRLGFWALSRFEDVWNAARNPERFSSLVSEASALMPMMIFMDPPRHDALRALVSRAFTTRRIAELEPMIRAVARGLIERCAGHGGGDMIADVAGPLPGLVIGELIGVPEEQRLVFTSWAQKLLEADPNSPNPDVAPAAEIYRCFAELLAERRRSPAADLMSALLDAEVEGERLTEEELLGFCFLLVVAGSDTTTNLIGNGVALLAQHPHQRASLVEDPTLLPNAIQEMLRYEPPAQALPRSATRDIELHGVTIPAGARVSLLWAAANRDEREFDQPERFEVRRRITRHLSFGTGTHFCLGFSLAELEARVAFEELLRVAPTFEIADQEPPRVTSGWARAFRRLPVILNS